MITGHVFIATSLDGFIARNDGDIEWLLSRDDQSEDHGYNEFIKDIDGIVMGRGSFEKVVTFEPWPYSKPVVVLSKKLAGQPVPEKLKNLVSFVNMTPNEVMDDLATRGWKKVYVDGGQIIQSFIKAKLIEDMVISTVPVLIGSGRTLFGSVNEDAPLKHLSTKSFPSGLVQSKYSVCSS